MLGVVRGQQRGVARQVGVPQARDPEPKRCGAQQRRHQAPLGTGQRAQRGIGVDQRARAVGREPAGVEVDAPVVQAHGDVEREHVDTGEIEVEHAGQAVVLEQRVVAEQVGVDRAARQRGVERRAGHLLLVAQLRTCERVPLGVEKRQHQRQRLAPPSQAAQVGLLERKVAHRQVHAREPIAHARAVRRVGRQVMPPGQPVDQRRRLAGHAMQDRALRIGVRPWHRQAAQRQVLHQRQVERQLVDAQALEQGQHIARFGGVDEIVGVLDPAAARLQRGRRAQAEPPQEPGRHVERDLGIDRHRSVPTRAGAGQKLSTCQTRLPVAPRALSTASVRLREPSPVMIS